MENYSINSIIVILRKMFIHSYHVSVNSIWLNETLKLQNKTWKIIMKLLIGDGDIVLGCNQKKKENIPAYFSTSKCYTKQNISR